MTNKYRVEFDNKRQSIPMEPQDVYADSYCQHSDGSLKFFLEGRDEPIKSYAQGFWGSVELVDELPKPGGGTVFNIGGQGGVFGGAGGGGGSMVIGPGGVGAVAP